MQPFHTATSFALHDVFHIVSQQSARVNYGNGIVLPNKQKERSERSTENTADLFSSPNPILRVFCSATDEKYTTESAHPRSKTVMANP